MQRPVLIGGPLFFVVFRLLPFIWVSAWCVGDTHSYLPHTQCGGGPIHGVSETRYIMRVVAPKRKGSRSAFADRGSLHDEAFGCGRSTKAEVSHEEGTKHQ